MRISAIVPTRNRGEKIIPAVESVLRSSGDAFLELILVDQSTSDASLDALRRSGLLDDARLHYHRMHAKGASRARNLGIRLAHGDVLAFTDDDCVVPVTWISDLAERFRAEADLAVLYPEVAPAPDIDGFIPTFRPRQPGVLQMSQQVFHDVGFTANAAVRRSSVETIGPFDELLGAGTPYISEDKDFGYRALRAGLRVEVAFEPAVVHYGVRQGHEVAALGAQYMAGFGAMIAKHVRCGDAFMTRVLILELRRWVGEGLGNLAHGRRPSGLGHAFALLSGFAGACRFGVDRRTRLFYARGSRSVDSAALVAKVA